MKHRVHLLASTAATLIAATSSSSAFAQATVTVVDGANGTGTVVTADPNLGATNSNVTGSTSVGNTSTQTVYTNFKTTGGNGSGGGAGLGGVFFVDSGASLSLTNVSFANNSATGGQGGGVKVTSIAPFAFSATATSVDASAFVQNFIGNYAGVGATYADGAVTVNSLTLQQNALVGTGSGVGLVLNSNNLYPDYSSSVSSVTSNADGSQTLNLSTPITLGEGAGYTTATFLIGSNTVAGVGSVGPTAILPGMSVVGNGVPAGVVVDQVGRDSNGQINLVTFKNADGSTYQNVPNASVYIVNGLSYDISRFASSVNNVGISYKLVSTGALAGFSVGQTVTGTGVPAGTVVTAVSTDSSSGTPVTTVTLSNPVNLQTATNLKASSNPVVSNTGNAVLNLASVAGLAAGQAISGAGIPTGTTITAISGNTVTLSSVLGQAAINAIRNSTLLLTVDPVVATSTGSVTLASVSGFRVGDAISGSSVPANARITGINTATNTISYVIDPSIATANYGGSLNGLLAPGTPGSNGTNGKTGTNYGATFDNGEGAPGSNATGGGDGTNAAGGNGGSGGSGSNGSSTNKTLITTLALDTASLVANFLRTDGDAAGLFTLPSVPGDIAATIAGAAAVAFDTTQLVAWQLAEKEGLVALGGQGGQGGNGGNGTGFFGGGSGGRGGNGGNGAEPQAPVYSIGGAGGNGGNGGDGGFGAGGGNGGASGTPGINGANSGSNANGSGGSAGFGGGTGSSGGQGGQGGSGYGGAIFVRSGGALTISGNSVFQNNAALAGSSSNGGAAGSSAGSDLFMMTGSAVTLSPGVGNTITFYDSIADDSSASISGSIAAGQGAGLTVTGGGTVQFFGTNTYTGATNISGGTLEAQDGSGINPYSQIRFSGTGTIGGNLSLATAGVLLSGGTITRAIGSGPTNIAFAGSGGFAATSGNLLVNLGALNGGSGPTLIWGGANFIGTGQTLVFGSDAVDATGSVTLRNAINLAGGVGNIAVYRNAGQTQSFDAAITGAITNGQLTVGDSGYAGTLLLAGQNTLSGITLNTGTVTTVNGALTGRLMDPTAGGFVTINGGTLQLSGLEKLTTVQVASGGSLLASGAVTAGAITNAGISGFGALNVGSITNSGVLGLMGTTNVTGNIVNQTGGTVRQFGVTNAANVTNAGTYTLASDLTTGTFVNSGLIDLVGTMANGVETGATRTLKTFTLTGAGTINLGGSAGAVANTLILDQSGNSLYAGALNGAGAFTKTGLGTLTLTGASIFTGGLNVAAGTLDTTGGGTFADSLDIGVAQGAKLVVGTADVVHAVTNAGTLTATADYGVATLTNSGTATLGGRFAASGDVGNTGTIAFNGPSTMIGGGFTNSGTANAGGQIIIAGPASNSGRLTLAAGSAAHLGGTLTNSGMLTGAGVLVVDGQVVNAQGGTVTLVAGGGGTQFAGLTNAGTLSAAVPFAVTGAVTNSGTVTLVAGGGGTQFGSLANSGTLSAAAPFVVTGAVVNSGTMTLAAGSTPSFGSLVNSGGITASDALVIAGSYRQDAGSLVANGGLTSGSLSGAGGTITLNNASQFLLNQSADASYAGNITGNGTVVKTGAATLTLAGGANSITPSALGVAAGGVTVQRAGALGQALVVAVAAPATLTLAADQSIASLASNGTVVIGGDLTTSGGVVSNGTLALSGTGVTRTLQTNAFSGGAAGVVQLGGIGNTLILDQSGNSLYAGALTGAGAFTKTGLGTLTLTGASSFTGGLNVAAGTLDTTGGGTFADSLDIGVAQGAKLVVGTADVVHAVTNAGTLTATADYGVATLANSGTATLGGRFAASGDVGNTGTIAFNGPSTMIGGGFTNSGTANAGGQIVIAGPASSSGRLTLAAGSAAHLGGTLANSGMLTGAGVLVVDGQVVNAQGGTVTLVAGGGGTQFAGLTNAGTLSAAVPFAVTGAVVNSGTVTLVAGGGGTQFGSLANSGTLSAAAPFVVTGAVVNSGTMTLAAGSTPSFGSLVNSGGITASDALVIAGSYRQDAGSLVANGGLTSGSLSGAGGTITLNNASQFLLNQSADASYAGNITGNGTVVKTGAATLTLAGGANSITPTLAILQGGVTVRNTGALNSATGVGVASGATLTLQADQVIRALNGVGTVAFGDNALTLANGVFIGPITGTGAAAFTAGSFMLGGALSAGTVAVQPGGKLTVAPSASVTTQALSVSNGLLDLQGSAATTTTAITNGGVLHLGNGVDIGQPGAVLGTLTSGTTTIDGGGALTGNGTVTGRTIVGGGSTGTVAPGNSPGVLTFTDLTYANHSVAAMQIDGGNGPGVAGGNDLVVVNGTLTLQPGSTLAIAKSQPNGYEIPLGQGIQLFRFATGNVTGSFGAVTQTGFSNGLLFNISNGTVYGLGSYTPASFAAAVSSNPIGAAAVQATFVTDAGGVVQYNGGTLIGALTSALGAGQSVNAVLNRYSPDAYAGILDQGRSAMLQNLPEIGGYVRLQAGRVVATGSIGRDRLDGRSVAGVSTNRFNNTAFQVGFAGDMSFAQASASYARLTGGFDGGAIQGSVVGNQFGLGLSVPVTSNQALRLVARGVHGDFTSHGSRGLIGGSARFDNVRSAITIYGGGLEYVGKRGRTWFDGSAEVLGVHERLNGFAEQGSTAGLDTFNVRRTTKDLTVAKLDAKIGYMLTPKISAYAKGSYTHEFGSPGTALVADGALYPVTIAVTNPGLAQNRASAGLGLQVALTSRLQLNADASGGTQRSYRFGGGVKLRF